ncbi:MAG: hypothetical protein M1162_01420 [Candidatus Thermoplasmatota archaeon]|nr:hypothetical protein [Candidatus Thermoplasmatota archaeon]
MSEERSTDIRDLKEVLEVVGEKVPPLLSKLLNSVMNKENAEEYAKQVSTFYRELKESGMDEENAMKLTRSFMESRDPVALIKGIIRNVDLDDDFFKRRKNREEEESED